MHRLQNSLISGVWQESILLLIRGGLEGKNIIIFFRKIMINDLMNIFHVGFTILKVF